MQSEIFEWLERGEATKTGCEYGDSTLKGQEEAILNCKERGWVVLKDAKPRKE